MLWMRNKPLTHPLVMLPPCSALSMMLAGFRWGAVQATRLDCSCEAALKQAMCTEAAQA